jgi:glycerophosphoryl diester phosphodiesterase
MWPYPTRLAHRGGGVLAPENTLAGVRCGLEHGYHAVEFDVMLARDGIGVVIHDPQLGRTVAGSGNVCDIDSAQLNMMDAGSWFGPQFKGEPVPLFTQFVDACVADAVWMNIEIKPAAGFEAQTGTVVGELVRSRFADAIAAKDWARVPLLSSFSVVALVAAQAVAPDVPRGLLVDIVPPDWQAQAARLGAVAIHTNHKHLTPQLAGAIREAGFGLFCYTVNDPARAVEITGWGVNGFCTDRIDLIAP